MLHVHVYIFVSVYHIPEQFVITLFERSYIFYVKFIYDFHVHFTLTTRINRCIFCHHVRHVAAVISLIYIIHVTLTF